MKYSCQKILLPYFEILVNFSLFLIYLTKWQNKALKMYRLNNTMEGKTWCNYISRFFNL